MLAKQGIIPSENAAKITSALQEISNGIADGSITLPAGGEDIHMCVEALLTERVGDIGKSVHTARSRNDQVALDLRIWQKAAIRKLQERLRALCLALADKASEHTETVMPGLTHLQPAQPVTFAHHLMAYANMFLRDIDRLSDCLKRTDVSPIGSCALAGTTYGTDREYEAELLGFSSVCDNSMDGVSDRDFAVELCAGLSIIMMHLSRFCEEIILWSSAAFGFITLDDAWCTGSSIMPQKKNPDIAELIRGKTGRVYGSLTGLLTMLKGLPMAYNKDMQEDKEALFNAVDTTLLCLEMFTPMLNTARVNTARMRLSCEQGFINATDCADYLVLKGLHFRDAYKITGLLVKHCEKSGLTLETLPLPEYQSFSPLFDETVYTFISLDSCVSRRTSLGGPAPSETLRQIAKVRAALKK